MENESLKVSIWVTTDCNMKCKYCYEGTNKEKHYMKEDIASKTVDYIVEQMKLLGKSNCIIHFHGGEPLLAYKIIQFIIKKIKKSMPEQIDIHYSITTNATLINEKNRKFLAENFRSLSLSIDGDEKSHDFNRQMPNGNGTHKIVLKNSLDLLHEKILLRTRMTVTPDNVSNLSNNIIFLINSGFTYLTPGIDIFNSSWTEEYFLILQEELIKTRKYIDETNKNGLTIHMVTENEVYNMGMCTGGKENINIDTMGNIFPCTFTVGNNEFICGNIFMGVNLKKISELDEINGQVVTDCVGCTYYNHCMTSKCKLVNKCITGDFLKASPVICSIENIKLKLCQ